MSTLNERRTTDVSVPDGTPGRRGLTVLAATATAVLFGMHLLVGDILIWGFPGSAEAPRRTS